MSIRIIAVGKNHDSMVSGGIGVYEKRLNKLFKPDWILLSHSQHSNEKASAQESDNILGRINPDDFIILLDERGEIIDSPRLSKILSSQIELSKNVVFIIGGAYGVDTRLKNRADFIWSLSRLVFPHQLVRLMLIEQIYRSQEIYYGKPYHHE